ncbi:TerB family tellurite resistance protein [Myroides marinus]|uniref:tellurite resistance TerB family protein n=1 Tax=Bacteroidota TaxID=976 RepID=UPI000BFD9792|nr:MULTISPECIES: TerB family tellurite resistance protein [Bacteroidota]ATN06647.1 hypothetical protein CRN76_15190 [Chryseobacterium indologenes]MDM1364633.1 TerB family tellurite resistance protein [Myroides marinus]MDM1370845.1 TerB family tellurite resistance protein [Myroides marinus]MDM1389135.1 TerB family tellurite resistance protein [Myroides marinus]MDM1532650.1 TerB family tellurite resistance protein [Myroides marinus]
MDIITFDKLLLKTAFCCMASDGNIDRREIKTLQSLCQNSDLFEDFDFQVEINKLVEGINKNGNQFIRHYLDLLSNANLSEQEELTLIDFAIQTIYADEQVEYSEIKFFKNIRHRLKISDGSILSVYPDIEQFLEEDILTESFLDKITNQYFNTAELPKFSEIDLKFDE